MQNNYEEQINQIIADLTLEEKANMLHGMGLFTSGDVSEKGIPGLETSDGPMGVRNQFPRDSWFPINLSDDFVSYMPSNSAVSATWNPDCAYAGGKALGEEARGRGKDVILAPGINIKRDPLCGRNFEYMSEDPYLVEELVVPMIKGIQEADVAACVKHYALNNQETNRLWVDTFVDERTLREIYLPGFKAAVQKAGTYSLMNAYNKFEGVHCSANKRLLDSILREEWRYDGTVISDWGSVHTTKETAEASMDLEMSVTTNFDEYFFAKPLVEAVEKGEVKMEDVDAKVRNILRMMYRLKMLGPEAANRNTGSYNTREHQEAVRNTARESMVLLKNEENVLPITKERVTMEPGERAPKKKRIAVIGRNAEHQHAGGGGSAEIKALYEISPIMGLKTYLGGNVDVVYAPGYFIPGKKEDVNAVNWQETSLERQISRRDFMGETEEQQKQREEVMKARKELREEAVALAKSADEVIFVGGLNHDYDVEGWDRDNMKLPYAQDELVEALLEANPNTIVTIVAGSPVEMPWRDKAKAILWCYYAGMETGHAFTEVLFGDVNPSGKLPESFPAEYTDTITYKNGEFGKEDCVTYKEGIFYGYRYYEKEGVSPAFAFGHGLSYTTFGFSDLAVEALPQAGVVNEEADLEKATVKVSVKVTNTGKVAGAEVVQCYVSDTECSVERPVKELKAFGKVFLEPGETKTVELTINNRGLAFYDVESKAFVVEAGEFGIHVGSGSDKIAESAKIFLTK